MLQGCSPPQIGFPQAGAPRVEVHLLVELQ